MGKYFKKEATFYRAMRFVVPRATKAEPLIASARLREIISKIKRELDPDELILLKQFLKG